MIIPINKLLELGATVKRVSEGEIIFMEGSPSSFYHQLQDGSVRWVNIDEEGKEFIQMMVRPGECFGELPLFDDQPYAATAIANEDCSIIRLNKHRFHELLKNNPDIHFEMSKLLAERIRFKFLTLQAVAYNDPSLRISMLLKYFKEKNKNICPECGVVKLTRQQIADMTGLRVETVIRTMRNMHDKGLIQIQKGKAYFAN